MEVFVEFEVSCKNPRSAELIKRLFRSLSENKPGNEIVSSFEEYDLDSNEISGLEELIGNHLENLGCLETAEVDGKVFRSTFICGWGAEIFLAGLAKVSESFNASLIKLTAQYDEGVYVCDLINGKPHLEEFEDYETYQETGFENLAETSDLAESIFDFSAEENAGQREKTFEQPVHAAEIYAEQERTVLSIAKTFLEDTFNGIPLDFSVWYSDEYHASGWLEWLESPEISAERNREWADSHDGVKNIDVKVKGQIEGLVSIDAQITLHDGKVKESNSCWIFQNSRWQMHNSCSRIWIETQDLSDEELEIFKEFDELFTKLPAGDT